MVQFDALPQQKQDAIRNAAFLRFVRTGYKKASVADIAAAAGIAKASIFQYFGSKLGLYKYLLDFAIAHIINETPPGTSDYFECLQLAGDARIRVMARFPDMYEFLSSIVNETDSDAVAAITPETRAKIARATGGLFAHVDWSTLKPGVDMVMMVNMVRWVNEGYIKAAAGKMDAPTMRRELNVYMDILKKICYREESTQ